MVRNCKRSVNMSSEVPGIHTATKNNLPKRVTAIVLCLMILGKATVEVNEVVMQSGECNLLAIVFVAWTIRTFIATLIFQSITIRRGDFEISPVNGQLESS